MTCADRTFWSLEDEPSSAQSVRSVLSDVAFLAVLIVAVGAFWLWGPKISVVLSESMDPTYTAGDALFVVPWGAPSVGDIVQFRLPLAPGQAETTVAVTHRIIGEDERGFITKGDNPSANPDGWRVTPEMIEGKVLFWMPQVWMFRIASLLVGVALLLFLWPTSDEEPAEESVPQMALAVLPQGSSPAALASSRNQHAVALPPANHPMGQSGAPSALPVPHGRPVRLPPPTSSCSGVS